MSLTPFHNTIVCPHCTDGTQVCEDCDGTGEHWFGDEYDYDDYGCDFCDSTGIVRCWHCKGTRQIMVKDFYKLGRDSSLYIESED